MRLAKSVLGHSMPAKLCGVTDVPRQLRPNAVTVGSWGTAAWAPATSRFHLCKVNTTQASGPSWMVVRKHLFCCVSDFLRSPLLAVPALASEVHTMSGQEPAAAQHLCGHEYTVLQDHQRGW